MSEKVSLIIPVYNVEKYLHYCIESIISQNYKNIEIILIDDQSSDQSGEICDRYREKDNRIIVIHKKNGGAASARNAGLDVSTGEYVMFVDSDDWLEPNAIELLLNLIKEKKCDIVQYQYTDEYVGKSQKHSYIKEKEIITNAVFVKTMLTKWEYIINCNKLYKASVIGNSRFVEGHCIDDEFFTYKVIINSNQIYLTTEYLYHYRQRRSSAMGNEKNKRQRMMDQIEFVVVRYPELCKSFPELKEEILEHLLKVLFSVMCNGAEDTEVFNNAKKKLIKYGIKAIFSKNVDVSLKKSIARYVLKNRKTYISPNNLQQKVNDILYE